MYVATLTYPGSPSHGASLQMFALYTALKQLGADVDVINYVPDTVIHKSSSKQNWKMRLKKCLVSLLVKDSKSAFKRFEKQINLYPEYIIKTTEEIKALSQKYDRIIVGSDQVWNPVVTGNDMNFYLEFCEENFKKASYAPSFGVDNIENKDRNKISKLLSEITYLSAREERGREIIKELTGRDVPVVLDPTFLISADSWRKIKKASGAKGKYVFVFTIKNSPKLRQAAQSFANAHGCNLVYIAGGLHGLKDKFNRKKHPVFGVGPAEFLDLIDNAEYVFTNSFHGTALSIILNKKFRVEFSSDTNSRLENIVKTFGLEKCKIDCDNFDNADVTIDYDSVNQIIASKKSESIAYLKGIIY